jgi:hypothetical protein
MARLEAPAKAYRMIIEASDDSEPDVDGFFTSFSFTWQLDEQFVEWCVANNIAVPTLEHCEELCDDVHPFFNLLFPSDQEAVHFKLLWDGDATLSDR